ncbi:MAG: toxin TcdB middle/N-terminal domain-containing protein, partial [Blastocatellia bacterium]
MSLSTGNGFTTQDWSTAPFEAIENQPDNHEEIVTGDFSGDGKTDVAHSRSRWGAWRVTYDTASPPDLLSGISNGLGGTTTITYKPSTTFPNTLLPLAVQVVSSTATDDGNGNTMKTNYSYAGGYYHLGERDYRGFNYVKVNGPAGANGEQSITETWFHQGNDTTVDLNNPNVAVGYMKGKPYRVTVSDETGKKLSETTTSYTSDNTAPFFNPPEQVDNTVCDSTTCGKQTRVVSTYDPIYGNVIREEQYGDLNDPSDDRTVTRDFAPNPNAWILGLPTNETIYQGIGSTVKMAATDYYYDAAYVGGTDCSAHATDRTPVTGNLTRIVRWSADGASPDSRRGYDEYG